MGAVGTERGSAGEGRRGISRRQLLAAGAVSGAGVLAACGRTSSAPSSTVAKSAAVPPAGSDLGAVEHVIFLMMENRSFDHYYGTYPGVRGFDDHPADDLGAFSQAWPANTGSAPAGRLLPFHLDTVSTDLADCTFDLTHNWGPQHQCRNEGRMDSFVRVHTQPAERGPLPGDPDHGLLHPGRPALLLRPGRRLHPGRRLPLLGHGPDPPQPAHADVGHPRPRRYWPAARWSRPTDPPRPCSACTGTPCPRSWRTPASAGSTTTRGGSLYSIATMQKLGLTTDSVLPYFSQYQNPSSALYQKAFLPTFPGDFAADVQSGNLPKVSWISTPVGYDEHPPAPSFLGEWFTDQVLQTLVANPDVWSKTVLFHMYDENDGFFDHVPPPVAPPGTAGEFLTVDPLPADAARHRRPDRPRLPGPPAGHLPLQPGRAHQLADLRPHLPVALHRGAVRGAGTPSLRLAAGHRR